MNSAWKAAFTALLVKEFRADFRNPAALVTAGNLSLVTVFTLAFAFYGRTLSGEGGAGMLWAALLFAGVSTLSRGFVAEEEQGTADLLRLWANPMVVFWGKVAYAFLVMLATSGLVALLFVGLSGVPVAHVGLLLAALVASAASLAATVTFTSALISRGRHRSSLAGVASLPLMFPVLAMGVGAGRTALGVGNVESGWSSALGVALFAALVLSIAPYLFATLWKEP